MEERDATDPRAGPAKGGTVFVASIPDDLFTIGIPTAEKAIRTVAVYLGLVVLLRLAGKRDLAQLNTFDFVVLLLLSNVVQNAIIGDDNSLSGGLLGAAILVLANSILVRLVRRNDTAIRLFEGQPVVLVRDGRLDIAAVHRLGLRSDDVVQALRHQGANDVDEVREAVLEPGGSIVVSLKDDEENATKADVHRLEAKLDALLSRQS
jgi:uncharacterized membrane protein YcaP (DUF421 family)